MPLVLILLAASAVRLLGIGNTDLWGDEAFSVMTAVGRIGDLVAALATGEPHPPLFPIVLAAWLRLFGRSEALTRIPSAFFGIASVAVAASLGRRFAASGDERGANRAALVAALVVTFNPIQIWYSQEARMYQQLSFFAGLSTLTLIRLIDRKRGSLWPYSLAIVATAGSHYYGLFVPVAHGLAVATRGSTGSVRRSWMIAIGLAAILYVPWVYVARGIFIGYYGAKPGSVDLPSVALSAWVRLASAWSLGWTTAIAVATIVSFFVAAGALRRGHSDQDETMRRVLLSWLFVPFILGLLLSLVRPLFAERYLTVSSLALLLLVTRGVVGAFNLRFKLPIHESRLLTNGHVGASGLVAGLGALAIVLALAIGPLTNVWSGRYVKSTYNTHVKDTTSLIRPGDAIILDGTSQTPLYSYYVDQPWVMYPLPRDVPLDPNRTIAELNGIAARHSGAWIFLYATSDYDPQFLVARWLSHNAYRAFDDWAVTGRLQYYRFDRDSSLTAASTSLEFGDSIHLTGYQWDGRDAAAGDTIPIAFQWTRPSEHGPRLRVSLRLVDQSGFTWAQSDQEIGGDFFDEGDWPTGQQLVDRHGLMIPPGTPPGTYRVLAHAYRTTDPQPLPISGTGASIDASGLAIGNVRIVRPSDHLWSDGIGGFRPSTAAFGDSLALLGYAASNRVTAGGSGFLTMAWKALKTGPPWTDLHLDVLNGDGQVIETRDFPLATKAYPTSSWQAGDVLREQYRLPVRANLTPGTYHLSVHPSIAGSVASGTQPGTMLGTLVVDPSFRDSTVASPTNRTAYTLGDVVALDGFDLGSQSAKPGDHVGLTLHWRATATLADDYTVFVHLLDASNRVVAQRDSPPAGGSRPTSSWFSGDIIVDSYDLELPAGLPAGTYVLEVGMYNAANGSRLGVLNGRQAEGDRILLARVEVSR